MADPLCLLAVHAHPDDEASKGAGTVAKYREEGIRSVLVCCTGGEEGEILNPAMDLPEVHANLAAVRHDELLTSAELDTMLDPTALSGGLFDTGPLPALTPEAIAKVEAALDEADRHDKA